MQRVSEGYTVIEVLIFLAISVVIFLSAVTLIGGRQSHTQFEQSVRDFNSQIQDWANDASTGFAGGTRDQYHCVSIGGPLNPKVRIDSGAPPPGLNNPDCIFIGKAIQFTDSSYLTTPDQASKLYAYSVFGVRIANGGLVSNTRDAGPTPAIGNPGGPVNSGTANDLWSEYDLPPNIKVTKLEKAPGTLINSHILGFYLSFNTEQSTGSNGSEDLKVFQYPLPNEAPRSLEVYNCINNQIPCQLPGGSNDPTPLSKYIVCLSDGTDNAYLTITSPGGIGFSTSLNFGACP